MSVATALANRLRVERGCGPIPEVEEDRCLRGRFPRAGCRRCEDVCPVAAVEITATGVALAPGCIGCEVCITACPTGALHPARAVAATRREGFDRVGQRGDVARITCVRQPGRQAATATYGCLGGVDLTSLLAPLAAGAARVEVERGGCARCSLSEAGARFATTVAQARALAVAFKVEPERICEVAHFPKEVVENGAVVGRRDLFRRLGAGARRTIAAVRMEQGDDEATDAGGGETAALAPLLRALGTASAEATLPAGLRIGRVVATDGCFGCNVCETLCPTGALRTEATEPGVRLLFNGSRCVGCGVCAEACLAGALTVRREVEVGWLVAAGEVVLVEVARRRCSGCGSPFTGVAGDLCEACLGAGGGLGRLRGGRGAGRWPLQGNNSENPKTRVRRSLHG